MSLLFRPPLQSQWTREPNMAAPPLCHTHRGSFLLTGKMADENTGEDVSGKNQWTTGWMDGEDTAGWRLM